MAHWQQQPFPPQGQQAPYNYGQYGQYPQGSNTFQVQAWQAYGFAQKDDLWYIFEQQMNSNRVNQERHAIQIENLVRVMNESQSIRNYYGINWSRELCAIMLLMMDQTQDGFMQWNEFQELQQCLLQWHRLFKMYDVNNDGFADATELLNMVIHTFRYNITPKALETILKRYSYIKPGGRCILSFDDFVTVSVRLRALTDAFRRRDQAQHHQDTGQTTFLYDDFLRCVMCL